MKSADQALRFLREALMDGHDEDDDDSYEGRVIDDRSLTASFPRDNAPIGATARSPCALHKPRT
jgi:hypothetical protein